MMIEHTLGTGESNRPGNISIDREVFARQEDDSLFSPANQEALEAYMDAYPNTRLRLGEGHFSTERCFYNRSLMKDNTATIIVPFDLSGDLLALSETLHQLNTAAAFEEFEVILGAGRSFSLDGSEAGRDCRKYDDLTKYLYDRQKKLFPSVRLRTALIGTDNSTLDKTWDAALRAVIGESIDFKRSPHYPIIRYDPGSKSMCRLAIRTVAEDVRNKEAHLVKMPASFTYRFGHIENTIEAGLGSTDPTERQAATITFIYALTKDIIESQLQDTEERVTYQETGSGAQLINWIRVLAIARQGKAEHFSEASKNNLFIHIARTALDTTITPLRYAKPKHARIYLSHQHIKELAEIAPPWQLPFLIKAFEDGTYKQMNITPQPQRWAAQDVMAMTGIMILRQEALGGHEITIPPQMQTVLAQAIEDGGFWHNEQQPTFNHSWLDKAKQLGALYLERS